MPPRKKRRPSAGQRTGRFRSKFELSIARKFNDKGIRWKYELYKYAYYVKSRNPIFCPNCGEVGGLIRREYLPDFFLSNGVVIEAKGRLTSTDRTKLSAVRKYHPELDLRILFMSNRILSKARGTRYVDWAESEGIPWAVADVPEEWLLHADQTWPRGKSHLGRLFKVGEGEIPR